MIKGNKIKIVPGLFKGLQFMLLKLCYSVVLNSDEAKKECIMLKKINN